MLRRLAPILATFLLILPVASVPAAMVPVSDPHFVAFQGQIPPDARQLLESLGAEVLLEMPQIAVVVVAPRDANALKTSLSTDPRVRYVVPVTSGATLFASPQDTDYVEDRQPYLDFQGFPTPWGMDRLGVGIVIASIDTGVNMSHPDIQPNLWTHPVTGAHGFNLMNPNDPGDVAYLDFNPTDPTGSHGTMVAGVAMAIDDGLGVVGAAPRAQLMPIRALGDDVRLARAVILAVENGARVILFPQGFPLSSAPTAAGPYPALHDAIRFANANGTVVVAAAGLEKLNSANHAIAYPAAFPEVIAVNAANLVRHNPTDVHMEAINTYPAGSAMDLAASHRVWTTCNGTARTCAPPSPGSSYAAPQVAGAAAILISCRPLLQPVQVQQILNGTADDIHLGDGASVGFDNSTGNGNVNMTRAMGWLGGCSMLPWGGPPAPSPTPSGTGGGTGDDGRTLTMY